MIQQNKMDKIKLIIFKLHRRTLNVIYWYFKAQCEMHCFIVNNSGYKSVLQLVSMGISNLTDLSDVIASLLFCVPEVDTGVVPSV